MTATSAIAAPLGRTFHRMPDRVKPKPKRITLAKLATLLDLPEGVTVASVGHDADTATIYLAGADSRRLPLTAVAALLDLPNIGLLGIDGDDVVALTKTAADAAAPPAPDPTKGA